MKFDRKYFTTFASTKGQVAKHLENAFKDFHIASHDKFPEVRFAYAYSALIKGGIALLSTYNVRVKSVPGHHIRIIEQMALLLDDRTVVEIGNLMRSKRNIEFYAGGVEVTEKECREYLSFVEGILNKIKKKVFV